MKTKPKDRYNILFISSFASLQGGGQRSLLLLLRYLDRGRYAPFLIVPEPGELAQQAKRLGVTVFIVPLEKIRSWDIFSFLRSMYGLRAIVKRYEVDIVHTESPRETLYGGLLKILCPITLVFHARVSDSAAWLDRILYAVADTIIAVSHTAAKRFRSWEKSPGKVEVVYNAVECDPRTLETTRHPGDKLRVGYFGRIEPRKGLEVLIQAVDRMEPAAELVIRGDGDTDYVAKLKELPRAGRTVFAGYKPDIRDEMRGMDVIVLPAVRDEGLSRMIVEAMALGKIVAASAVSANKEALGDALKEFIFPVGDFEALAALLTHIARYPDIIESKKTLFYQRAAELFEIKKNTKMIEQVYDKLLALRNQP